VKIVVVGAGVGGLAVAVRLAARGHDVTVLERADAPGGSCGRLDLDGFRFDTGPSLLTMPWVLADLIAATGAALSDELDLVRVEPVTEYRFADGSKLELSADLPRALEALEAWSPGSSAAWMRFLAIGAQMWRSSGPFLSGPAPWPLGRDALAGGAATPGDPRDFLRVRPWWTLRQLARAVTRDPRLRMVIERFATYAGADPRRAPAALAVAGYVEHAFGGWHVAGGLRMIVEALARRLAALGGELRTSTPARRIVLDAGRVVGVEVDDQTIDCDAAISGVDALALHRDLLAPVADGPLSAERRRAVASERSLSGFVLMMGLSGSTEGLGHHTISFPTRYGDEFDDVFSRRRPVVDPALYVSLPQRSDPACAPPDGEALFVLANAPAHGRGLDWDREAEPYAARLIELLAERGIDVRDRVLTRSQLSPADLERRIGAPGGAIYGAAPHGRLASLRRPPNAPRGARGLYRVGGSAHPGGGLPLVMLSAKIVADQVERGI